MLVALLSEYCLSLLLYMEFRSDLGPPGRVGERARPSRHGESCFGEAEVRGRAAGEGGKGEAR